MVGWAMLWWVLHKQPDMGWFDAMNIGKEDLLAGIF